jgi:hypothetical protein
MTLYFLTFTSTTYKWISGINILLIFPVAPARAGAVSLITIKDLAFDNNFYPGTTNETNIRTKDTSHGLQENEKSISFLKEN